MPGEAKQARANSNRMDKELADGCTELFRATVCMFEQEHLRFIKMVAAAGNGGTGGGGGDFRYPRSAMENKVIQDLRAVNGDKPFSVSGTKSSPRHSGKLEA